MSGVRRVCGKLALSRSSIPVRMMLWYGLWTMALIAAASGLLYGGMETRMEKEQDNQVLADYLRILNLFVDPAALADPASSEMLHALPDSHDSYVYARLIDDQGRVRVETPGMSDDLPSPDLTQLQANFSAQGRRSSWRSSEGRLFELLQARLSPDGEPGRTQYLQIALDRTADDFLDRLRDQSWMVLTVTVLACALVGYTIAKRSIRPVEVMSRTMQRIQSTQLHERIDASGLPKELSSLAGTFNQMLDRLEESFERISEFSDNVAHELRSPMGNLQTEMEIALRKPRTNEEYRDVIGSCLEESARVSRILQGLLFLARGRVSSPMERERVDVSDEMESLRLVYEPVAADAGIHLELDAPAGLDLRVDRTLMRQAFANLIANAIEHTKASGRIRVHAEAEDGWIVIAVTDTGCGIAPEHLPHVFDRFYRIEAARSGSPQHAGLGLAIVKSIVEQHDGVVRVESRLGEGTTVRVQLPRARC